MARTPLATSGANGRRCTLLPHARQALTYNESRGFIRHGSAVGTSAFRDINRNTVTRKDP
ncbi:hypothetical protein AWB78_06273 [Caballeronia calidae]|uniref:Uncharacterized protein n=1 Tax=Caballeronia calidae TaxID=1777139 RepID=A0A158E5D3_9BURK|nr:hypothetical protein AWB78_06273 [Caballeronia calidae]